MKFRGGLIAPGGKPGKTSTFLKLEPQRKVSSDPRKLLPLKKHEGYRHQYAYVVFISQEIGGKWLPIDARVVKTLPTLNRIAGGVQKEDLRVLLHPQPVKIPPSFWKRYRQAKSGKERLELAKGLTTDKNIFALVCIVLDWDSPYEECEPVFLELVRKLGIQGYECGETKSGNFRAVIYLEPLRVEKKNEPIRAFYLTAQGKGRNGHTHLQNFREIVAILNAYARKRGLKADDSFKRVNHPVWYGEGFYSRVRKVHGETKLYDLYRKAKELQREGGLWEVNREFWKEKCRENRTSGKVVVPPFVARIQAQKLDDLYRWQIAARRLSEKYTSNRFTKVILPAVSWAMDLGLSRYDVDSYLKELLPDKKDMDAELEKAWRYARPQRFEWRGGKIDLKEKLIEFLENTEEEAPRQFLLSEVFHGQNWMLQIVERFAIREGLIAVEKRKLTQGPGRKSYVYVLTEKGKSFVESLKDKARNLSLFLAVGFDIVGDKKSIYKTSSFRKKQGDISTGLVGDGRKKSTPFEEEKAPPKEEVEMDLEKVLREYVFSDKNEAISFLESLNGKYRIGDRVKVWVRSPARITKYFLYTSQNYSLPVALQGLGKSVYIDTYGKEQAEGSSREEEEEGEGDVRFGQDHRTDSEGPRRLPCYRLSIPLRLCGRRTYRETERAHTGALGSGFRRRSGASGGGMGSDLPKAGRGDDGIPSLPSGHEKGIRATVEDGGEASHPEGHLRSHTSRIRSGKRTTAGVRRKVEGGKRSPESYSSQAHAGGRV